MEIKDPARLHERFLIFPFYCSDCGKRFMLENGAIEKVPDYEFGDRFIGYKKSITNTATTALLKSLQSSIKRRVKNENRSNI